MTDNGTDPGLQALEVLSDLLMIDAEWSIHQPRRVTWWPYRLAQHIDAGNPVRFDDGHAGCLLRVWTDLVADVTDPAAAVGVVNQQESMSAVVYDSERPVMSEAFTSLLFADTGESWATVMSLAAVMQTRPPIRGLTPSPTRSAGPWRSQAIHAAVNAPRWTTCSTSPSRSSSPKGPACRASAASSWNV